MASNSPTPSGNSAGPRKAPPKTGPTLLVAIAGIVGIVVVLYLISWIISGVTTTLTDASISNFGIPATLVILLGLGVIYFILSRGKKR